MVEKERLSGLKGNLSFFMAIESFSGYFQGSGKADDLLPIFRETCHIRI